MIFQSLVFTQISISMSTSETYVLNDRIEKRAFHYKRAYIALW